jgi:uncharacterized membrane protein
MKIDFADAVKKALVFCLYPKRWLPFFILDVAFFSVALALLLANIPYFLYFLAGLEDITMIGPAANLFFSLVGLFIAWLLLGLWITGALVHQSNKEHEFGKSWAVSFHKYLSILGVTAVTAVIAFLVAIVPYVGWLISILVGIALFFSLQSVVVKGNGFIKALEDSWHIFRRNPFKVFLMWISVSAIALLMLAIFAIPLLALIFNIVIEAAGGGAISTAMLVNFIFEIENQLPLLVVSVIIFILGMAISRVFSVKAQTEFYNQIKKK